MFYLLTDNEQISPNVCGLLVRSSYHPGPSRAGQSRAGPVRAGLGITQYDIFLVNIAIIAENI